MKKSKDLGNVNKRHITIGGKPGKPSKTYLNFWLYEEDPEISRICPHPEWKGGKWMMFFESTNIDKKWDQAIQLYRQGKLFGVHAMKVCQCCQKKWEIVGTPENSISTESTIKHN